MPEDREIEHAAHNLIERHGARASAAAQLRVDACEREGHEGAAAIWRRIAEKIRDIQTGTA